MRDYFPEYRQAIDDGKIQACQSIKQALDRAEKDRQQSKESDFPYYFDSAKAKQALDFIHLLSGKEIQLFQGWIISELMGWRLKADPAQRRYSSAFVSMARKNGKSWIASALADLYLLVEQQPAQLRQVLLVANTERQSLNTYDMCSSQLNDLCNLSPAVRSRIRINATEIKDLKTGSKILALANNIKNFDSFGASFVSLDEFATAQDAEGKRVLQSGMIGQPNGLFLEIGTTSQNPATSPMKPDYDYAKKVLDPSDTATADRQFIAIFEQDNPKKEAKQALNGNPTILEKSNPLLCLKDRRKVMLPKIVDDLKQAYAQSDDSSLLNMVLVKNLNAWLTAKRDAYISLEDWKRQEVDKPSLDNRECWIGVDLSKSDDLTAVSILYKIDDAPEPYLLADSHVFIATKKLTVQERCKREAINYIDAIEHGQATVTDRESGMINFKQITDFVQDLIDKHNLQLQCIGYDPFQSQTVTQTFEAVGYPLVEVTQTTRQLGEAMRLFRDGILNGQIKHVKNSILDAEIQNAQVYYDIHGNFSFDKKQAHGSKKIDAVDALVTGYSQALDALDSTPINTDIFL